jgi:hypothetical protein
MTGRRTAAPVGSLTAPVDGGRGVQTTLRRRVARAAAVATCVALIGSGGLAACSSSDTVQSSADTSTTVGTEPTPAPVDTLPEVVSDTTLPGGETSGKVRAPAPDTAEAAAAVPTSPPPANPQPNLQVRVEIAPNFPRSIPLPDAEQVQANSAPPGSPPESSASLLWGQEVTAAVGNYEAQLKSAGWKVTSKVSNPEYGELKATRANAELTAIFSPGETKATTVGQISVKGDAG